MNPPSEQNIKSFVKHWYESNKAEDNSSLPCAILNVSLQGSGPPPAALI